MSEKATLVIGASTNPERYAYKAIKMLKSHQEQVLAYGNRTGDVDDVKIHTDINPDWEVETITLYIGPKNQDNLLSICETLSPKRVIFNPGTENPPMESALRDMGISCTRACTLVLLSTGQYHD